VINLAALPGAGALLRARQRLRETAVVEGLEQVVERVDFEGADGVAVVGGDEDDGGHRVRADLFQHRKAIDLGHLDVEEEEIRTRTGDQRDGVAARPLPAAIERVGVRRDCVARRPQRARGLNRSGRQGHHTRDHIAHRRAQISPASMAAPIPLP